MAAYPLPHAQRAATARKLSTEAANAAEFYASAANDPRWAAVLGYEGRYDVSERGHVRSIRSGRLIAQQISNSGYLYVSLWAQNKGRGLFVHRLVAGAFLPKGTDPALQVNHKDGDKLNNALANLEMVTPSENRKHAVHVLGFRPPVMRGVANPNAKPVARYSLAGELLEIYACQADAVAVGFRASCITECCQGTQKTHGGYRWAFADAAGTSGGKLYVRGDDA
ncbi:NUMOD4 motif-containing HNH endonuclease [Xenophilus sp. Marseille-Q4582]|uniref:NUMOD4 motif-containing HNH endonuclease n=1 Tax=Xenophilus sp. Marseille-Q4582 TaxID=2866600 RepID=UPI001CE3E601|nr:NUMOD4 motif-containing HNH endonuclease [Xenophilus sp. Marseille-Q4582]